MPQAKHKKNIAIIGAGPAGLMAAEELAYAGYRPTLFDAMPTPARKFLMAGKSGLNITHSEPADLFLSRYGDAEKHLGKAVQAFGSAAIQDWAQALGSETFVGSSGRVFPKSFKASPLLRAWLKRLQDGGARLETRHEWTGWDKDGALVFNTPRGPQTFAADATILALGGVSWPRLGSTGTWQALVAQKGIPIVPFRPANCGFDTNWSDHFRDRFEGEPIKNSILSFGHEKVQGDFVISRNGVEGSAVYSLSAALRDHIEQHGPATLTLDLCPDRSAEQLAEALARPRGKKSMATHIRKATGLVGAKAGLLRECLDKETFANPARLAHAIKSLPLVLQRPRPIEEAISVAGGIPFDAMDQHLMLKDFPGVFCAGEMVDWEAPTGGYLLTACFAQGRQVAKGVMQWLDRED